MPTPPQLEYYANLREYEQNLADLFALRQNCGTTDLADTEKIIKDIEKRKLAVNFLSVKGMRLESALTELIKIRSSRLSKRVDDDDQREMLQEAAAALQFIPEVAAIKELLHAQEIYFRVKTMKDRGQQPSDADYGSYKKEIESALADGSDSSSSS